MKIFLYQNLFTIFVILILSIDFCKSAPVMDNRVEKEHDSTRVLSRKRRGFREKDGGLKCRYEVVGVKKSCVEIKTKKSNKTKEYCRMIQQKRQVCEN